jgi:predicted DNA binding CopG/RHH family protein
VTRPGLEIKRLNLDLPEHMLAKLDKEAALRGITRQSLIKVWLYEKLTAK